MLQMQEGVQMSFKYFTSMVNYRIKINEDGTCSAPEILSKFTKETYEAKSKKTKTQSTITLEETGEEFI